MNPVTMENISKKSNVAKVKPYHTIDTLHCRTQRRTEISPALPHIAVGEKVYLEMK